MKSPASLAAPPSQSALAFAWLGRLISVAPALRARRRARVHLDETAKLPYRAWMSSAIPLIAALQSTGCAAVPHPSIEGLRSSLEKAELDFAASVAARGVDAWVDTFAEDGVSLDEKGTIVRGHAAIRAQMTPVLAKVKINWHPTLVDVAPSGDMGFTYGPYEVIAPREGGKPAVVARGTFMTVWKRGPDGVWKAAADHGSEDTSKP